jgi:hypothetical protein
VDAKTELIPPRLASDSLVLARDTLSYGALGFQGKNPFPMSLNNGGLCLPMGLQFEASIAGVGVQDLLSKS